MGSFLKRRKCWICMKGSKIPKLQGGYSIKRRKKKQMQLMLNSFNCG
jgi:hypothetical protein